jgi:hypothetical protein
MSFYSSLTCQNRCKMGNVQSGVSVGEMVNFIVGIAEN